MKLNIFVVEEKGNANPSDGASDGARISQEAKVVLPEPGHQPERQTPNPPIEHEFPQEKAPSQQDIGHPSESRPSDSRPLSPAPSNGSLRSGGAVTPDGYPVSERAHSPVTSVRRVDTGSPSSERTAQQGDQGHNDDEVVQPQSTQQEETNPSLPSSQLTRGTPSRQNLKAKKVSEQAPENFSQRSRAGTVSQEGFTKANLLPSSRVDGSKRPSLSGNDGRPPGSFPGADNIFGEPAISDEEEHPAADLATTSDPLESKDRSDLANTKHEKDGPRVKFKGSPQIQPQSDSTTTSDYHNQLPAADDRAEKNTIKSPTESPTLEPARPKAFTSVSGSTSTEQLRRPSKEALRRTRRPSVYIPLSKVAEAKGKIEAANVQPPQSGVIVNAGMSSRSSFYPF